MSALTISVAMCTYNGERYLQVQLDSIAAQTRPPDELLICDDGSSDSTREIIEQFSRRAQFPTHLIVNQENLGTTRNFEKAVLLCRGDIVALSDQDDLWFPHKLQRIEAVFLKSSAVVGAFSDAVLIDQDTRPLGLCLWRTLSFTAAEQIQFARGNELAVLMKHPVVTGATLAFRKDRFDAMLPLPANEIHDRWISFLLAATGRLEAIPEPLMQYRQHGAQQIGPGPLSKGESLEIARSRKASFYLAELDRFRQLRHRLVERKGSFPAAKFTIIELDRKILHAEHRAHLPMVKAARLPKVIRETLNGNYWRYSGGWKSIAKDLIV